MIGGSGTVDTVRSVRENLVDCEMNSTSQTFSPSASPGLRRERVRSKLLSIALLFFSSASLWSQPTILLIPPSLDEYPTITTGFYPLDTDGQRLSGLQAGDFELREKDVVVPIDFLECPSTVSPDAVSVVLAIDVSSSMKTPQGGKPLLTWVEEAARTLINDVDFARSEVGTISFSDAPRLLSPITTNRSLLLTSVSGLTATGGTDFYRLFLDPDGGIARAAAGLNRRILVLFTDGEGAGGDTDEIIRRAKGAGVSIYIVVTGSYALPMLKEIAEETGGLYVNAFQQTEGLNGIARMILTHAEQVEPCRIRWRGLPGCEVDRRVVLRIPRLNLWGAVEYDVPESAEKDLTLSARGIRFGRVAAGSDSTITVRARADFGEVGIVRYRSTVAAVSIPELDLQGALPLLMQSGESHDLLIRYRSEGGDPGGGMIIFESDACQPDTLFITTERPSDFGDLPEIRLLSPNGGESFQIGSIQTFDVEGGDAGESFHWRISLDNGAAWSSSESASPPGALDVVLPEVTSDRCLASVHQDLERDETFRLEHPAAPVDLVFSGDSVTIATLASDGVLRIFDLESGLLLRSRLIPGNSERLTEIGGTGLIGVQTENRLLIVDPETGEEVVATNTIAITNPALLAQATLLARDRRVVSHRDLPILYGVRFFPDSNGVARPQLYRYSVGESIATPLDTLTCYPRAIDLSDDGRYLAFGGSGRCLEIRTGGFDQPGLELQDPHGDVIEVQFDQTGEYLAVLSHDPVSAGYSVTIRRSATGSVIFEYRGISPLAQSLDFERFSDGLILGERYPTIRELTTGVTFRTLQRGPAGNGRARSHWARPLIATTSGDSAVLLWRLDQPYRLEDQSDSLWRIVAPDLSLASVDFGERLVDSPADTTVVAMLVNNGSESIQVTRLPISGGGGADYSILSPAVPFDLGPGQATDISVRFRPSATGPRPARLGVGSPALLIESDLSGAGALPALELRGLVNRGLDFGGVLLSESRSGTFSVANVGDRVLRLDSIVASGPEASEFGVADQLLPRLLEVGEVVEVPATFMPAARGVRYSEYLLYYSDTARPGPTIGSPAPFLLYGTGLLGPDDPALSVLPVDTLRSDCGEVVREVILVRNGGNRMVILEEPYLVTGDAFRLDPGVYPLQIDAGETAQIVVAFSPGSVVPVNDRLALPFDVDTVEIELHGVQLRQPSEITATVKLVDGGCDRDTMRGELEIADATGQSGFVSVDIALTGGSVGRPVEFWPRTVAYQPGERIILPVAFVETGAGVVEGRITITPDGCGEPVMLDFSWTAEERSLKILPIDTICLGATTTLAVEGLGSVVWDVSRDVDCSNCPTQPIAPRKSMWIRGELVGANGCTWRDSVFVVVKEPVVARLVVPSKIPGTVDEIVAVPIVLNTDVPIETFGRLRLIAEFDEAVFRPEMPNPVELDEALLKGWSIDALNRESGRVIIEMSGPATLLSSGELMTIRGLLFLGESRTSRVDLSIDFPESCSEVSSARAEVDLDSICGLDDRLITIGIGPTRLQPISPNPVTGGEVAVGIELSFDRHLRVDILDTEGRVVATILDRMVTAGTHSLTFVTESMPNGTYYLVVHSDGWKGREQFLLTR